MRGSLLPRLLGYLTVAAFAFALLQATGILGALATLGAANSGAARNGVFTKAAPGVGPKWRELHARYAADIAQHEQGEGLQLAWYGDDLVESWRGSAGGAHCSACEGGPSVWGRHFGSQYRAQSYGIAGDQTANVLWRLRRGERARRRPPAVTILHAGAADLDAAFAHGGAAAAQEAVPGIVSRIESSLQLLHGRSPEGRLIVLALLPRVPPSIGAAAGGPAGGNASGSANSRNSVDLTWPAPLAAAIEAVNRRLEALTDRYPAAQYVDCSPSFLQPSGQRVRRRINAELIPEGRQPSAEGMHRLGLCLDSLVHFLVTMPPPLDAVPEEELDDPTPELPQNLQTSIQDTAAGEAVPAEAGPVAGGHPQVAVAAT